MSVKSQADVGVFGGSGFYSFLKVTQEVEINTEYGKPSDSIVIGELQGLRIAFLPRHGRGHTIPPHKINFRANVSAMKELGVKQIFAPCAVGSLQPQIRPGSFVICDQFVDRTNNRTDTFYDGPHVTHISTAEPYCPQLRKITIEAAMDMDVTCHHRGTVVVIQGPRFSTKSESRWYSEQDWEVINMTQYPEVTLARELEICYVNISLVTDYDSGLEGNPEVKPVSSQDVMKIFMENNEKLKDLLFKAIPKVAQSRQCICSHALDGAAVS